MENCYYLLPVKKKISDGFKLERVTTYHLEFIVKVL